MDTKSNDDSGGSDSLDKSMQRKCVMVETSSTMSEEPAVETDNCSRDSAALHEDPPPPGEPMTDASSGAGESSSTFKNNSNNNTTTAAAASAAFETKVKLISQNLKETTLAETDKSEANVVTSDNNNTTTGEQDCDHRVKRVRFHPDVKPNDGGNRVKKKKRCPHKTGGDATTNQSCDGMEMDDDDDDGGDVDVQDDEDEEEQEEEFNLAKTIAEADDYLKQHPLTFVRRVQQNGDESGGGGFKNKHHVRMSNAMDNEMVEKHDSDKDFYKKCKPENGIERILGKETKAGKASTSSHMTPLDLNNPTHFAGGIFIALRESGWALLGIC